MVWPTPPAVVVTMPIVVDVPPVSSAHAIRNSEIGQGAPPLQATSAAAASAA